MPAGRPTELTPQVIARVPKLVPRYPFLCGLATKLGVTYRTLRNWFKRGCLCQRRIDRSRLAELTAFEALCVEFFHALQKAAARWESRQLQAIDLAGAGWQAHAWLLQRRFPGRYGQGKFIEAQLQRLVRECEREASARERAAAQRTTPPGP